MTGTRRRRDPQRIAAAQEALTRAYADADPACLNDDRFTASRPGPLDAHERRDLYLTCFGCPLFEVCAEYADAARPAAGYWAGKNYGTWERKGSTDPG